MSDCNRPQLCLCRYFASDEVAAARAEPPGGAGQSADTAAVEAKIAAEMQEMQAGGMGGWHRIATHSARDVTRLDR